VKAVVLSAKYEPQPGFTSDTPGVGGHRLWSDPQLSIENVPEPDVRQDDDVILRVLACGLCGTDLHASEAGWDGYMRFSGPARLPVVPGHEFVGEIVAKGKAVNIAEGEIVTAESVQACGRCRMCAVGHLNQCESLELIGLTVDGALTEFVRVKSSHCYSIRPILDAFGYERGIAIGTLLEPLGCAYNGLLIDSAGKRSRPLQRSERVVVFGCGPIGLGAIAIARTARVSHLIAFDLIDERITLALKTGAQDAYNVDRLRRDCVDIVKVIEKSTEGLGATIVVEAAGCADLFPIALKALSPRGRLIYLGRTPENSILDTNILVSKALNITGSRGHAGYRIFEHLIELIASGHLDVSGFITTTFKFHDAIDAFARARAQRDGKVLIYVREK